MNLKRCAKELLYFVIIIYGGDSMGDWNNDLDKKTLKWNLDVIMKERDLSNEDVVQLTSIHRNVISRIKNNSQNRIDLDVLERLLQGLNLTPNDLLRYEDD